MNEWRPGLPSESGTYDLRLRGEVLLSVRVQKRVLPFGIGVEVFSRKFSAAHKVGCVVTDVEWRPIPVPEGV